MTPAICDIKIAIFFKTYLDTLADPGGALPARAPQGSRFFRFDIQIFRNIAASGVGAPHEVGAPTTGNPGSATETHSERF